MICISRKRCIIGEGPVWNEKENVLYFVNSPESEICKIDISTGELSVRSGACAAAVAFDTNNKMLISAKDGVYYLSDDGSLKEIYDTKKYSLAFCNDMKVGPDGRLYVGTQSSKRVGASDKIDGKLYSIDKNGNVRILLDSLRLSNGMEWSNDEKRFYHTDSDTNIIKEYNFDKISGDIEYTGRQIELKGVDGFTVDSNDNIYAACWGMGYIAVVDTAKMEIKEYINTPAKIPASCAFCGEKMNMLAVVTASRNADISKDVYAGMSFIYESKSYGRAPYLFGREI